MMSGKRRLALHRELNGLAYIELAGQTLTDAQLARRKELRKALGLD